MLTEKLIKKKLDALETLFTMGLEKCRETRIELGLVEAPAPRKGKKKLDEKAIQRIVARRNIVAVSK